MKRRIIYFTIMCFTAVLCFSCSDMLAELNGKNKAGATNGEPLSIELTAGKPQKNGDSGQKLAINVAITTDSEVKKVVWKKGGTEIAKKLLADESAAEATATDDNKKWIFEITATNETDGNGTYTVAVLDGIGRREAEQISITNQFDFTNPPKPDGTKINADYPAPTDDTSIRLTWSEPDETAEPNYDHAEITLTYTQDDGNGGTKTSDPVSITVNKGTTEYTFTDTDLTDDKKKDYTFTIKYVDTTGNESEPCSVTVTKYTLTYPTDETGATATKSVLVRDGEKLKADQLPPALPDTSDHYFAGWYDSKDNTKTLIKEGSTLTGDVTLVPKWECGISYDKGGHGTEQKEARVDEGSKITVSQLPVPEPTESEKKDGWKFAGWYLDSSCSDEKKVPDNYEVTKNTTLYAKWIQQKGRTLTESVRVLDKDKYKGTAGEATDKIIYVEFGDWPQTIKNDEAEITNTKIKQGMFTYYLGSNGEWYVKQAEKAFGSGYKYSDTTPVGQNGQSEKWFKVEPIKWRVLTKEFDHDNDASTAEQWLLLAENILAGDPYNLNRNKRTIGVSTVYSNNYKYSTIRAWLNGKYEDDDTQEKTYVGKGFLQSAFTSAVQSAIKDTSVDNSARSTNPAQHETQWKCGKNQYASDIRTSDKIFLLSVQEVTTSTYGFDDYDLSEKFNKRIRVPTDYARATGAYDYSENGSGERGYGGWWWLRSPDCDGSDSARYVSNDGDADDYYYVVDTNGGIVPALSISAQ